MIIDWVNFYREFADKLLEYKNNRKELLVLLHEIFEDIELNYPFKERGAEEYDDICPFTVFGAFNKGIKEENRFSLLRNIKKTFKVLANVPTGFDAIPVLNNLSAWFFEYKENRQVDDIDNLWVFFECALNYADNPNKDTKAEFIKWYDIVLSQKQVKWNITMGLFWVRPYNYINLDSTNRSYLLKTDNEYSEIILNYTKLKTPPTGVEYLNIISDIKGLFKKQDISSNNFIELSDKAFLTSSYDVIKDSIDKPLSIEENQRKYWMYSPGENSKYWSEFYKEGIIAIGWDNLGDLKKFKKKSEITKELKERNDDNTSHKNDSLALWQFSNEISVGDVIYVKKGRKILIGRGIVENTYFFDNTRKEYKHVIKVKWTHNGEWEHPGHAVLKTLTDISSYLDYIESLESIFNDDLEGDSVKEPDIQYDTYTDEEFLSEVFVTSQKYNIITELLRNKKNLILQGPPGVGKTFAAKRIAYSMMNEKDYTRVMMIQFHQSYGYEDFIMGYRPVEKGFDLKSGPFYNFCKKASDDIEKEYFFIIDEINRGNLSKIFGELLMLIEADKRGYPIKLMYKDEMFSVPKNIYIIGMMNTADRSLAMIDYALRRRFAFIDFEPGFTSEGFKEIITKSDNAKFSNLINQIKQLNVEISKDDNLGEGFTVGHSYFCLTGDFSDERLKSIINHEIIPLLKEYWYDEKPKVTQWSNRLLGALSD